MKTLYTAVMYLVGLAILFSFFLGIFLLITVPIEMSKMAEVRGWPFREEVIERSFVSETVSRQGGRRPVYWNAAIRGVYVDSGEEFWVNRVRYGDFPLIGNEERAERDVALYPPGTRVNVYYSPSNPRDTVLESHAPWDRVVLLLGVGTAGFGLPFVLYIFGRIFGYRGGAD